LELLTELKLIEGGLKRWDVMDWGWKLEELRGGEDMGEYVLLTNF